MCRKTNLQLTPGGTVRIGMMLKKAGFERLRKGNKVVFRVIEIPIEEVEQERKRKPGSSDDNDDSADLQTIMPL